MRDLGACATPPACMDQAGGYFPSSREGVPGVGGWGWGGTLAALTTRPAVGRFRKKAAARRNVPNLASVPGGDN
jgi:hypothetical protein